MLVLKTSLSLLLSSPSSFYQEKKHQRTAVFQRRRHNSWDSDGDSAVDAGESLLVQGGNNGTKSTEIKSRRNIASGLHLTPKLEQQVSSPCVSSALSHSLLILLLHRTEIVICVPQSSVTMFQLQMTEQDNLADTTALFLVPTLHTIFFLINKFYIHRNADVDDDEYADDDVITSQQHPSKVSFLHILSCQRCLDAPVFLLVYTFTSHGEIALPCPYTPFPSSALSFSPRIFLTYGHDFRYCFLRGSVR
jgi:hypothetical protein